MMLVLLALDNPLWTKISNCFLKLIFFQRNGTLSSKTMQFRLSYQIAGNKAKKWISKRVFQDNKARQFSEKQRLLVCASGGKKCLFFGKFDVLCFLGKTVLRFAILPYYR